MPERPSWFVWVYYALIAGLAFGGTFLAILLVGRDAPETITWLLKCMLVMALVVGCTAIYVRRDGLHWSRYGVVARPRTLLQCIVGLFAGVLLSLGWAALVALWAPFSWQVNPTLDTRILFTATLASIAIGIAEEVGYRSYGMERLFHERGAFLAALLPTLIFIAAHIAGGLAWEPALLVVGSCGFMYATLMLATRSLPFVAAFHIANNLAQDALMRTSDGSLWRPIFGDLARAQANGLSIWISMAVLNLVVATIAWRYRQR